MQQFLTELLKLLVAQHLGEDVSNIFITRNMGEANGAVLYHFAQPADSLLDVPAVLVLHLRVSFRKVHCTIGAGEYHDRLTVCEHYS